MQVGRERAGELQRRRSATQRDHLTAGEQRRGQRGEPLLRRLLLLDPVEEARRAGQRDHGPAVHTLEDPLGLELVEIPPHGVDRDAELARQRGRDDPPVAFEQRNDRRLALRAESRICGYHPANASAKPQKTA